MKSIFNHWYAALPAILLTIASCSDNHKKDDPNKKEEPDVPEVPVPSGPTVEISDVTAEANTVTFTITPKDVAFYSYCIKSEAMTSDPVVCDPAEKKTFNYNRLAPDTDYILIAQGYNDDAVEIAKQEVPFKTKASEEPSLEIPHGETPFIEYGGRKVEAKSVIYYEENDLLWLFVSPKEGFDNHIDLLYGNSGKNDYISLSFTRDQLNKSIDMKSASERYLLFNSILSELYPKPAVPMISIDYHQNITAGAFNVTRNKEKIEGYIEFTEAETGKKCRIYATCIYDEEAATRVTFMTKDGKKEGIGSGFYRLPDDTHSEVFLSPGAAPMGDLITEVDKYYIRIRFADAIANEKKFVNLTDITGDFEFEYTDAASGKHFSISNGKLNGATGKVIIYKYALQGDYRIEYDITADGIHLEGYADHSFNFYSYYSSNQYQEGSYNPVDIKSVIIDESNPDYYQIWLLPAEGVTTLEEAAAVNGSVKVVVSPLSLNARTRYFHDEKSAGRDMSITYRGQEFNNSDTSYKGYVRGALLGKKIALEFGEEKIGLEGYYAGEYVEIK